MKTARFALAIFLAGTTATLAQGTLDTDGDGMVSMEELQALYPDFTAEQFAEIDTDASGMLDDTEVAVAIESGIIPATE